MAGLIHQHPKCGEFAASIKPDGLHIDQADPFIVISDQIMASWRAGDLMPQVTLDGDLLTLACVNRTVSYRLTDLPCGCCTASMVSEP